MDYARVDNLAGPGKRSKPHLVPGNLHQHEGLILIESRSRDLGRLDAAPPQLPARSFDEIGDALLWLGSLVDVLVPREHDVDAVPDHQWLERDTNTFRVFARVKEDAGGLSAILDVWTVVTYDKMGKCAHSLGAAHEIRQVKNAGGSNEQLLPAGHDSGYLWRANTFTRFIERDGGVYVELETVGLSRRFPPLLGWIIEPIARRIGRSSVERTLTEFRDAVRAHVL